MRDENQWSEPVIQTYLKEQDDSLAEVAGTDDDEIPMRSLTPDARVSSPVTPLLVKESMQETTLKGTVAPSSQSAKTSSAGPGAAINKISDKDDIFEMYRKLNN
jgi:hypothetical protein